MWAISYGCSTIAFMSTLFHLPPADNDHSLKLIPLDGAVVREQSLFMVGWGAVQIGGNKECWALPINRYP